jgi:hypothetical protein
MRLLGNDMWRDMADEINDQEEINDGNNIIIFIIYIVKYYLNSTVK